MGGHDLAWPLPSLSSFLLEPRSLADETKDPGRVGSPVGRKGLLRLALSFPSSDTREAGRTEEADARGALSWI